MNDAAIGRIVFSRAGRDKGRAFVIVGKADDEHVFLVDGDLRKIANPKKKKLKHINVTSYSVDGLFERLAVRDGTQDAFIRKALEPYAARA